MRLRLQRVDDPIPLGGIDCGGHQHRFDLDVVFAEGFDEQDADRVTGRPGAMAAPE